MAELVVQAPCVEGFTAYDGVHIALYLSLLHAKAEGKSNAEIARSVLGADVAGSQDRAAAMLESHYRRALWLSGPGLRYVAENTGRRTHP